MNLSRIRVITRKEWLDMRKNKMVLGMMFLLPLVMVAMILGTAAAFRYAPEQVSDPLVPDGTPGLPPALAEMDTEDRTLALLNDQYMFYLLIIPVSLPVYIASYSIIGEKETRSLEPILATPISTSELLIGKILGAVLPAIVAAWVSYLLTAVGIYFLASRPVFLYLIRPIWTIGMLIHSPLFALISGAGGVIASSRVNDPRAAQQISALLLVPLIGASLLVLMGRVYLDTSTLLWVTPIIIALNAGILWLTVRIFQRETILTRWR